MQCLPLAYATTTTMGAYATLSSKVFACSAHYAREVLCGLCLRDLSFRQLFEIGNGIHSIACVDKKFAKYPRPISLGWFACWVWSMWSWCGFLYWNVAIREATMFWEVLKGAAYSWAVCFPARSGHWDICRIMAAVWGCVVSCLFLSHVFVEFLHLCFEMFHPIFLGVKCKDFYIQTIRNGQGPPQQPAPNCWYCQEEGIVPPYLSKHSIDKNFAVGSQLEILHRGKCCGARSARLAMKLQIKQPHVDHFAKMLEHLFFRFFSAPFSRRKSRADDRMVQKFRTY